VARTFIITIKVTYEEPLPTDMVYELETNIKRSIQEDDLLNDELLKVIVEDYSVVVNIED
jgi:hypothetical protein